MAKAAKDVEKVVVGGASTNRNANSNALNTSFPTRVIQTKSLLMFGRCTDIIFGRCTDIIFGRCLSTFASLSLSHHGSPSSR